MSEARFGKFEVVGFLGRGGMADVFLCRLRGLGGFDKEVVVKRILPERAADPSFVRMFLDEARVAANLNHPNIVQVFEIGEADGLPYIAMEYVHGPTFSRASSGETVAGQAAPPRPRGQDPRRRLRRPCTTPTAPSARTGEPLGLVHRDVSPQNIIVSPEGVPKLLDFGVAKARGRLATTEAGTLKGKLRYMAPEQIQQGAARSPGRRVQRGRLLCSRLTTGRNPFGARQVTEVAALQEHRERQLHQAVGAWPPATRRSSSGSCSRRSSRTWTSAAPARRRCTTPWRSSCPRVPISPARASMAAWMNEHVAPKYLQRAAAGRPARALPGEHAGGGLADALLACRGPAAMGWGSSGVSGIEGSGGDGGTHGRHAWLPPRAVAAGCSSPSAAWRPWRRRRCWCWCRRRRGPARAGGGREAAARRSRASPPTRRGGPTWTRPSATPAAGGWRPPPTSWPRPATSRFPDPGLNIRLLRLREEVETAATLRKAQSLVEAGETKQAAEVAKELLDRDPGNTAAMQLLAAIRRPGSPDRRAEVEPPPTVAPSRSRPAPPRDGVLTVTSNVPGMVYLDDDPIGRAPFLDDRRTRRGTVGRGADEVEHRLGRVGVVEEDAADAARLVAVLQEEVLVAVVLHLRVVGDRRRAGRTPASSALWK